MVTLKIRTVAEMAYVPLAILTCTIPQGCMIETHAGANFCFC